MCHRFYMAWRPHVFVEPIFFAIQNLDGAVRPSSFVFLIQFVIYILIILLIQIHDESCVAVTQAPLKSCKVSNIIFFFYVAFVVGAHNFGCFHASSESVGIFTWYIGTRNRGISHLIVVFFTNFSRFKAKRKYQFLTKTVGSFGTTTTLNIRWVNSKSQFVIPFRCYFQTSTWNIKPNNCNMKCPGDEWNGKLRLETTINCKKYFDISASFHVLKPPWRNSLSFQTDWGPARRCLCSAVGFLIPTNLVWTREKLQQLDLCVC